MTEDELSFTLPQSHDWFRALFEQSPLGVFVFDLTLRLRTFNLRFVRILRTTSELLNGLDLSRLRDQRVVPAMRRALEGKEASYEGPYDATTSDARVIVAMHLTPLRNERGAVVGAIGIVEDVTVRVRAQEALAASEARFRELIERSPDAICVYRGSTIVFVNPAMVTSLGYKSASAIVGLDVFSVIHPSYHARVRERRERMLAGEVNPPTELKVVRQDGTLGFIEMVTMTIDYDGAPAILSVARDTTERRIMQAELLQADRMASVGTLAAGVAHEINNPLAYLKGNLDALASRKLSDISARVETLAQEATRSGSQVAKAEADALIAALDEAKEMVRLAREGADQVRSIVADLRTFSRSDDAPSSWVDVQRVLDAAIHMAWTEVRARATLEKRYEAVPNIYANESRLAQVFLNVLINAAHAIPEARRGHILVVTRTGAAGEAIVEITDDGAGMKPELLARIFDPFFTTKPVGIGTGLGLWICEGIVTALGGRIEVSSEVDKGTTFVIVLPQRDVVASEPRISIQASGHPRRQVLVIDDQPEILRVIERALGDRHEVTCVNSGLAALEIIASGEEFSVILCDVSMPELDGIELFARATALVPSLASRFVFLTGAAIDPRSVAFLKHHQYISKPFDLRDLIKAVEEHARE